MDRQGILSRPKPPMVWYVIHEGVLRHVIGDQEVTLTDSNATWRKSSYSGGSGGQCVEVADAGGVAIRDTADRQGPMLTFSAGAWERFTASLL
jgi:hypothetical protein